MYCQQQILKMNSSLHLGMTRQRRRLTTWIALCSLFAEPTFSTDTISYPQGRGAGTIALVNYDPAFKLVDIYWGKDGSNDPMKLDWIALHYQHVTQPGNIVPQRYGQITQYFVRTSPYFDDGLNWIHTDACPPDYDYATAFHLGGGSQEYFAGLNCANIGWVDETGFSGRLRGITFTPELFNGYNPEVQNVGYFRINVNTITYIVMPDYFDAPQLSQTSFTFDLGITSAPMVIAWTQTARTQNYIVNHGGINFHVNSPVSSQTWLTMNSYNNAGGSMSAAPNLVSHKGSYTVILSNYDGYSSGSWSIIRVFTVIVRDPCETTTIQPANPMSNMEFIYNFDTTKTFQYTVKTEIELSYSTVFCALNCIINNQPVFVQHVSRQQIQISGTSPGDIGQHNHMSLTCTSPTYPSITSTFTFIVTIRMCTVSSFTIPGIQDQIRVLNAGPFTMSIAPSSWSDLVCTFPATYQFLYAFDGNVLSKPAFVTESTSPLQMVINPTHGSEVGVFTVTVVSTLPVPDPNLNKAQTSFTLTILKDCPSTVWTGGINSTYIKVTGSQTQSITIQDKKSVDYGIPGFCGPINYVFKPSLPSFLSFDPTNRRLTLASNKPEDVIDTTYSIEADLTEYPEVAKFSASFNVKIECFVLSLVFDQQSPHSETFILGFDQQPHTVTLTILKAPLCLQQPIFSLSQDIPTFISITPSGKNAEVILDGLTYLDQGNYPFQVEASLDGITNSQSVDLTIECAVTSLKALIKPVDTAYYIKTGGVVKTAAFNMMQQYDCHEPYSFKFQVKKNGQVVEKNAWIAFDEITKSFSIEAKSTDDIGVYVIETTVTVPWKQQLTNAQVETKESFKLTIKFSECMVEELKWPQSTLMINFVIGSPALMTVHSDLGSSNTCKYPIDFELFWDQNNAIELGADLASLDFTPLQVNGLPSFLTYEQKQIEVTSQEGVHGTYRLYVVARISNLWQFPAVQSALLVQVNISVKLEIVSNLPPEFPNLLPSFQLKTGESVSLPVPVSTAVDKENDSITYKVSVAADFIKWDSASESLVVDGEAALQAKASGRYSYSVKLTDGKGAVATYEGAVEFNLQQHEEVSAYETADKTLSSRVQLAYEVNLEDQQVSIGSNKKIYLPKYIGSGVIAETIDMKHDELLAYDPVTRSIMVMAKNATEASMHTILMQLRNDKGEQFKQKFAVYIITKSQQSEKDVRVLTAMCEKVSASGLAEIKFSENVISKEKDQLIKVDEAIKVEAFAFNELTQTYSLVVPLQSKCVKLQNKLMELQLTFKQPSAVSTQMKPDRLVVTIIDERLFVTDSDFITIEPLTVLSADIDQQFSSLTEAKILNASNAAAAGGSYVIIIGLIVGQFAGKSVVQRVWSLFMGLQIAVLVLDYEAILIPAVTKETVKSIKGIITIDALNPKVLLKRFWPSAAASLSDSSKFVGNLNPQVLIAIGVLAAGAIIGGVTLVLKKAQADPNGSLNKWITKLKGFLFFNPIIVSFQSSYLNLWISTGRQIQSNIAGYKLRSQSTRILQDDNSQQAIVPQSLVSLLGGSFFALMMAACLIAGVVAIARLINSKPAIYFKSPAVKKQIGSLYNNYNVKKRVKLHYVTFFYVRRIYLIAVFFLVTTPTHKIELISLSCYAAIYYCIRYQPFAHRLDTKIEIFNEACILIANQWQLAYSDIYWDRPEVKRAYCWFNIVILAIMILVNVFFLIKRTLYVFIVTWLRNRRMIKQQLKLMEEKRQAIAEAAVLRQQANLMAQQSGLTLNASDKMPFCKVPNQVTFQLVEDIIVPRQKPSETQVNTPSSKPSALKNTTCQRHKSVEQKYNQVFNPQTSQVKNRVRHASECQLLNQDQTPESEQDVVHKVGSIYFPFWPKTLRRGQEQWVKTKDEDYVLKFNPPEGEAWQERVYYHHRITKPGFMSNSQQEQYEAVRDECFQHWLRPDQADEIANRFVTVVNQPKQPATLCLLDRQVTWILEALIERHIQDSRNQLQLAVQSLQQLEAQRIAVMERLNTAWFERKAQIIEKVGTRLPDLQMQRCQLKDVIEDYCERVGMDFTRMSFLLYHWQYCTTENMTLQTQDDVDVARLLLDIKQEGVILQLKQDFEEKLMQQERKWEEDEKRILARMTFLQGEIAIYERA